MSEDKLEKRKKLIRLIRRIARDEVWAAMDEHLTDYEHKERPAQEAYT